MAGDEEWDDFLDDVVSNNEGEEQQRDRVIERQAKKSRKDSIRSYKLAVSTGPAPSDRRYEVIDTIFALDRHTDALGWLFQEPRSAEIAFQRTKRRLRQLADGLKASAVINCTFDYRVVPEKSLVGKTETVEFFAYGTAIRFLDSESGKAE